MNLNIIFNMLLLFLLLRMTILAQEKDAGDLAEASQNPVADMYSLPFQNNTTFGNSPYDQTQNILNVQPVLPFSISEKLNLINRIIAPIVTQPSAFEDKRTTGLGDINYTAWFSPKEPGKIIYGVGPVFQLPTATADELGSGEFGIGPSIVALTIIDKWVAGIVVNNIWTYGDAKENKFLFQYFINYNLPKAWYLVTAPIMTANWNRTQGEQWIIPVGGGIGKVFWVGKQPMNANAQLFYNVSKPEGIGDWQTRIQLQFLFPK